MRTRTKEIKIRLTEEEFNELNEKIKTTDMNRESFIKARHSYLPTFDDMRMESL